VFSHPEPTAIVAGMMIPRLNDSHSIYLAAGILGATVMPHVIYLHSALSLADAKSHPTTPLRKLFHASCVDVGAAMALASFVNLAMLAMAAAVFHGTFHQEVADIATAYRTLEPLLGPLATHVFGASLIIAGVSSTVVGTLAGQEVMRDFVRFRIPLWLRRVVTMTPSFLVILIGLDVGEILVLSQVVLSFGIALALAPLILFTSRRALMGDLANSPALTALAWAVVGLVLALSLYLLAALGG
jgi:manganese transport protein